MANERKRSVTTNAREAGKIKRLLEADLSANFDALKSDIRALTEATSDIAKWDEIVTELDGPAPTRASKPAGSVAIDTAAATNSTEGGDARAVKSAAPKK